MVWVYIYNRWRESVLDRGRRRRRSKRNRRRKRSKRKRRLTTRINTSKEDSVREVEAERGLPKTITLLFPTKLKGERMRCLSKERM